MNVADHGGEMGKHPAKKIAAATTGRRCRMCGTGTMRSGEETYLYGESGLPNVVLVDVVVRRCPSCGHHELVLPRVADLHRAIAHAVIRKRSRLDGAEVRFLRKYLGWSGVDFARHVGVEPSTVSHWENDKHPIGPSSDRLLRLMVAFGAPVDDYSLEDLTRIEKDGPVPSQVRLSPRAKGWEIVEPAA